MKAILIIAITILAGGTFARPETPSSGRYGPPAPPPSAPPQKYGPPSPDKYLPPPGPPASEYAPPKQEYGPPAPEYGPPAAEYGPPPPQKIVTKNVYVHIPPEEPAEIVPSAPIRIPEPKKHYKIIFIKAPTPPSPTAPVIPVQEPDEHKTLVYVLVKKPEPQPQIAIPTPAPTEPSKPEVYFIKYKNGRKPATAYGPPSPSYGPPRPSRQF